MDPYSILGVTPSATLAEIRRAYRAKARRYHPDVNSSPDATARMRHLNWAYEVLCDSARRAYYDAAWRAAHTWQWQRHTDFERQPPRWSSESSRQQPWSAPPHESAQTGGATRGYAGETKTRAGEGTKGQPSTGKIVAAALLVLWLLRALGSSAGGQGLDSAPAGSSGTVSGSETGWIDEANWDYQEEQLIAEYEQQRIGAALDSMYYGEEPDYSELVAEHYADIARDYLNAAAEYEQSQYLEDEVYADSSADYYSADWPDYP